MLRSRIALAIVVLLLNFVPFIVARLIGETMSTFEIAFNLVTIPLSLAVIIKARDPVRVLLRALQIGVVLIALGVGLVFGGKKLVELGERMTATPSATSPGAATE